MKITYDPKADVYTVRFREGRMADSERIAPGMVVDYDAEGVVLGFMVYAASKRHPPIDLHRIDIQIPDGSPQSPPTVSG